MTFTAKRAANNCITRARNLLDASTNPHIAKATREDLRRLSLVMTVVAIDTYLHWTVYLRLSSVRDQAELPASLRKLEVPFAELAALADASVQARKAQVVSRPWVQLKNAAQRRLLRMTMQSPQEVANGLSLVGIKSVWNEVAAEMGETSTNVQERLTSIVMRRNQIVHEGDFTRQQRPRRISHNAITRQDVISDIDFVEALLKALQKVVMNSV